MQISIPGLSADLLVQFPTVWSFLAYSGSWLVYFFWGFFAIYLFSSEFSQRTFRQNIISGLTRKNLYLGKIEFLCMIALAVTIYFVIWALVFGIINLNSESGFTATDRMIMIPRYFLMTMGYMSLGVFAAILVRKTAMSVFLYFAYTIFLEPMVRWLFHRRLFEGRSMLFYPANSVEDLTPLPLGDVSFTKDLIEQGDGSLYLTGPEATIASIVYITLMLLISFFVIRSRDL